MQRNSGSLYGELCHSLYKPLSFPSSTFQELLDTESDLASQPEALQTTVSLQAPQVRDIIDFAIGSCKTLILKCRNYRAVRFCGRINASFVYGCKLPHIHGLVTHWN